jgi:hypothetical protein
MVKRTVIDVGVLILGLALLVQGCTVGPDFKTPPAPVADKWLEQGNKSVDSAASEHRDWWTVFNQIAAHVSGLKIVTPVDQES